ncbi:NAD(P)-binding domain-containing protein [Corallococcus macrosporus]|uniref:NAD(P)-binding domain-containing protein n=1 Tax=Corallococcus macrosporus TaxID=35 RepID=A0ABS3DLD9_9BACT|nr:NAD(P)-binding domain-containing protein [Corallococcus macrosporus]MBN8232158.1 NAD(P)-binding domain-containing protein [Corallococcus macrosporus]
MTNLTTMLCVIGGGPTAVAALFEARERGIPALALEAGATPLASLQAHIEGLVYLSPASHWEVGGLPLDCRDALECSREDVLHYYARVIQLGRLDIRCRHRCVDLRPDADGVTVVVETPEGLCEVRAEQVLVTAWYERRPLPPDAVEPGSRVEVREGLRSAAEVAGRRVAVLGGGISGFEQAGTLMMAGQPVTLLMRGEARGLHRLPHFERLMEATGSRLVPNVRAVHVIHDGVTYQEDGETRHLPCDVLVAACGARLSPHVLELLTRARVLTHEEARRLSGSVSLEEAKQAHPAGTAADQERLAVESRPDLWPLVFEGRRRVRLAGGPLHVGASNAGVMVSIATAVFAVRAMAGAPVPAGMAPPLARALLNLEPLLQVLRADVPPERVESLRPLAVGSWSRAWVHPHLLESPTARSLERATGVDPTRFLLPIGRGASDMERELLGLADGTASIGEIADANEMHTREERAKLVALFRKLWTRNALTWLPPRDAAH